MPPPPEHRSDLDGRIAVLADRAWWRFRMSPTWVQVVGWFVGWWLLLPAVVWRSALPPTVKGAVTGVVAVAVADSA